MALFCVKLSIFLWYYFSSIFLSNQDGNWFLSDCGNSHLDITKLPKNSHFNGSSVEVINKPLFGPALYLRENLFTCNRTFAIPLPFSVSSIAYSDGYFYVIRDDVNEAETNWYRMKDVHLFGGYIFWMEKVREQSEVCEEKIQFPNFDSNNQWSSNDNSREILPAMICQNNLDQSFATLRIDIPFETVYNFGISFFLKLLDDFKLLSFISFQAQFNAWKNWEKSAVSYKRFTSVAAIPDLQSFLLTDQNFTIHFKPNFSSHGYEIGQFLSVTSFLHFGVLYYVYNSLDETIIVKHNNLEIRIGKLQYPLKKIYIFDELFVGINFQNQVYYSENYFSDVILKQLECNGTDFRAIYNYCYYKASAELPFTALIAQEKCNKMSSLSTYTNSTNNTIKYVTSFDECNVAVESHTQCHLIIPMNTSKLECETNGCCYIEFDNRSSVCFKKFKKEFINSTDVWVNITNSYYEYTVVDTGVVSMDLARQYCIERGGDLGYSDLLYENKFRELLKLIKNQLNYNQTWIGFTNSTDKPLSLNNQTAWTDYYNGVCGGCSVLGSTLGKWISTSCISNELTSSALCQRLIDTTTSLKNASFWCKKKINYCEIYSATQCSVNANCVSQSDYFQCICHEGYTGDGVNCYELPKCSKNWVFISGKCYRKFHAKVSFYEAEMDCQSFGGHLISIHNLQELSTLRDIIMRLGDAVWLGFRKLTGSENFCMLMDGRDCNFLNLFPHVSDTDFLNECLLFYANNFYEAPCHLSMKKIPGARSTYVCEQNPQQSFNISMMSHSFDVYPGISRMKINNQNILSQNLSSTHSGYIHLTAINGLGNVVYARSISPKDDHSTIFQNFLDFEFKKTSVKYIAVMTSKRALSSDWIKFVASIREHISDFPLEYPIQIKKDFYPVENVEFDSINLPDSEMLYSCQNCMSGCNGVVVSKTPTGSHKCEVFKISNSSTFKYEKVIFTSRNFKVDFRTKIRKIYATNQILSCPWTTVDAIHMGVNRENAVLTKQELFESKIDCINPPCIQQIACVRPKAKSAAISVMWFCNQSSLNGKWSCPIIEKNGFHEGLMKLNFSVPIIQIPFLATFDELINLGSPHIEFQTSVKDRLWSPAIWSWRNQSYAKLITGVKGRALRFSGQEASTKINTCLKSLYTPGITLSFWVRILNWPTTIFPIVVHTEDIAGSSDMLIDADDWTNPVLVKYKSLGCWSDSYSERAIASLEYTSTILSNNYKLRESAFHKCLRVAYDNNYEVFALQDQGQCQGSKNAASSYNKHGPSNNCLSNGKGGVLANEVYKILSISDHTGIDDLWYKLENVEYLISQTRLNFLNSKIYCESRNAVLAQLKTVKAAELVFSVLRYVLTEEYDEGYYIDLVRQSGFSFAWGDGVNLDLGFLTWLIGKPSAYGGDCVVLRRNKQLNNILCSDKKRFICQRSINETVSELGVFINPTTLSLDSFVRTGGLVWKDFNIPIQLKKWTYLVFTWHYDSGFQVSVDSYVRNPIANPEKDDLGDTFYDTKTCYERTIVLGRYKGDERDIFDIDHLSYFYEKTRFDILKNEISIPIRHRFLEKKSFYSFDQTPQIDYNFHPTYPDYQNSCVGSFVFCNEGFTLAFTLKISDPFYDPSSLNDHVVVISNLDSKIMFTDEAVELKSLGFSVQLTILENLLWLITLRHTLTEDFSYNRSTSLSWEISAGAFSQFFVQIENNGYVRFCIHWPTNCKTEIASQPILPLIKSKSSTTNSELTIGPVLLVYNDNSQTISEEEIKGIYLYNVWFLEQSLDLLMFSDEIQIVSSPVHFQVYHKELVSKSGFTFQAKGNTQYLASYYGKHGPLLKISNNFINGVLAPTWIELSTQQFNTSMPCLFNLEDCENGFTLQMTILSYSCDAEVSSGDCYFISTGGQIFSVSQGLAFYCSSDNSRYFIVLATKKYYWNVTLSTFKPESLAIVKISWSLLTGLNVFINDIVVAQTKAPTKINNLSVNHGYDPFTSFVVGKKNNKAEGFVSMEISKIIYWEGIVEGNSKNDLGECLKDWIQVGENCYFTYLKNVDATGSVTECKNYFATPPEVRSFSAYRAFSELNLGTYLLALTYRDQFYWSTSNMPLNATRFNFLPPSTSPQFSKIGTKYYRDEQRWEFGYSINTVVCMLPLVNDISFYHGCYSPVMDFNWKTALVSLHDHQNISDVTMYENAVGSYNTPDACRIACSLNYMVNYVLVIGTTCECVLTDVGTDSINQIMSTYEDLECSMTKSYYSDLTTGYSYLNFPEESRDDYGYKLKDYCGFTANEIYKCGFENKTEKRAALFGFDAIVDQFLFSRLVTSFTVSISSCEIYPLQHFNITIPSLNCCVSSNTICDCGLTWIYIVVDYNDGSTYSNILKPENVTNLELFHYYTIPGQYNITINISNTRNWHAISETIVVLEELLPILLLHAFVTPIQPGELAKITTYGISGKMLQCTWNYGDQSQPENISLIDLPLPLTYHRYKTEGLYYVGIRCTNYISTSNVTGVARVLVPIQGLVMEGSVRAVYGKTYKHQWSVRHGSDINCKVYFGNYSIPETLAKTNLDELTTLFYFDDNLRQGIAHIPLSLYQGDNISCLNANDILAYKIVVTCFNLPSNPAVSAITTVQFEVPIKGLTAIIKPNKTFFQIQETFCIETKIMEGSNIIMKWMFTENFSIIEHLGQVGESYTRQVCFLFEEESNYNISIQALNGFNKENVAFYLVYEIPISTLKLFCAPSILPNFESYFYVFHKPKYPRGKVVVNFGDKFGKTLVLGNFDEHTNQFTLTHRYKAIGIYNVQLFVYNNVSSINITKTVQVGVNISGLMVEKVSPRFLRTKVDLFWLKVQVKKGSELGYFVDFGDNTTFHFYENLTRTSPLETDLHFLSHVYRNPGNYTIAVEVKNVFGELNQIYFETIVVQNPLDIGEYVLIGNNISYVPFPTGFVSFTAKLKSKSSVSAKTGYSSDVNAVWKYANQQGIFSFYSSYRKYEIDHFPLNYTFGYESVGSVEVNCLLSNSVSQIELLYQFEVMEIIDEIVTNVKYEKTKLTNIASNSTIEVLANTKLTFEISVMQGSHVTYTLTFEDNTTTIKHSPLLFGKDNYVVFKYEYDSVGVYSLKTFASNAVSNSTKFFNNVFHVYDEISDLVTKIGYIDFDQEITGINIFHKNSEIYSLLFGKSSFAKESTFYLPLSKISVIEVSSVFGSNISVVWQFVTLEYDLHLNDSFFHEKVTSNTITRDHFTLKALKNLDEDDLLYLDKNSQAKYTANDYNQQSSVLIQHMLPGAFDIVVTMYNPKSKSAVNVNYEVLAEVGEIEITYLNPPVANKTTNITFFIEQVGSQSCYSISLNGVSLFSVGLLADYCLTQRGIFSSSFYLLTEDTSLFKGFNVFLYSFDGNLISGVAKLEIVWFQTFLYSGTFQLRIDGFNLLSSNYVTQNVLVTEILCDYPNVFLEKIDKNSIKNPRKVFSFLKIKIYSSITISCKLTSEYVISWQAYSINLKSMVPNSKKCNLLPADFKFFLSPSYCFEFVPGLKFTSKSESVTIQPRFLKVGLYLICINVAMYQVSGVNSSDCIYLEIALPPLVAGIQYGIRRAVGYNELINLNAATDSYDLDKLSTNKESNLYLNFIWSCPILVSKAFNESLEEASINFNGFSGWSTIEICSTKNISCGNSLQHLNFQSFHFVNESLALNSSTVEPIYKNLNESCSKKTSCFVDVPGWLQLKVNETDSFCLNITYKCDVTDTTTYHFVSSNTSCLTSGYYPISGNYSCASLNTSIDKTCGKVQLNTSMLEFNKTYLVRVKISDPNSIRFAIASQVIEVTEGGPPILRILCLTNCNLKMNPRNSISFKVEHINNNAGTIIANSTKISYIWSLYESNTILTEDQSVVEKFSYVEQFENMTTTGNFKPYLAIKSNVLKRGKKYHVRVEGNIVGFETGLTEVEIKTNLLPYNGRCEISPQQGIAINTTFTITCKGWRDEGINVDRNVPISPSDYTLGYQVLYHVNQSDPLLLLSYGNNETLADKYLPPGRKENNYNVWIQVRIIDEYGEWAVSHLNVTVYEAQDVEIEMLDNFTISEILTVGIQSLSQLSASVSGVLNQQINNSNQNIETKVKIRTQLLDAVIGKFDEDSDLNGIQQSCSTLGSLTEVPSEVRNTSQLSTIEALSQRSSLVENLAETYASEDIEETASIMIVGIKNVIQATQHQVLSNVNVDNSNVVPVPIFSAPAVTTESSYVVLNEEELFLSPLERVQKRKEDKLAKEQLTKNNQNLAIQVATNAMNSVNLLSNSVLKQKLPGEPTVMINTQGLSLQSQKNSLSDLCNSFNNSNEKEGQDLMRKLLLSSDISFNECSNLNKSEEVIQSELLIFDDNPFIWDGSADNVRSSVVSLSFTFSNGSKPFGHASNNTFRIEIPVQSLFSKTNPKSYIFVPSGEENMVYHELNIRNYDDVLYLEIHPYQDISLRIYFLYAKSLKMFPTTENHTFVYDLPDLTQKSENQFRIRLDGNTMTPGRYVFGIHEIDQFKNVTIDSNRTLTNYTLYNFVTSCRFWNETVEKWETTGCTVSDETTNKLVVCMCNHLTSFGADFLVAPNPIDFSTIATKLQNLKDNLSVLLTLIVLIVVYVSGVVFCRRQDKRDISKWAVGFLLDNKICDKYFYQITVTTGSQINADTKSNVFFVLYGEDCDTSLRTLKTNNYDNNFSRSSVRKFLLAVDKPLGNLIHLKIWHDNSGKNSKDSWYLQFITIMDLQKKKKFVFFCDDWLAVDQSDGKIERLLVIADDNKINSFKNLFGSSAQKSFSNEHLWFSLFSRPTKSNFTRVQRLSCAFAILFSTMLSSAMFFGRSDDDNGKQGRLEIGPFSFTIQQLIVSIQASLVVIPINVLLVEIFQRILPKKVEDSDDLIGITASTNSQFTSNDIKEKTKQSVFMFPYWMIYVAWSLVFLVFLVSGVFVFLYSVEWGSLKSNDWLLSILLSFIQSVLIIQPCKAILIAVVVSFALNKFFGKKAFNMMHNDKEDHENQEDLEEFKKNEEDWLMQSPLQDDFEQMNRKRGLLNCAEIKKARKAKEQHKMMVETIKEIVSYLLYVALLLIAANNTKHNNGFEFHDSLSKIFLMNGDPILEEVRSTEDFWNWCNTVLIPGLHATSIYNSERLTWSQTRYLSNRETFVTGPARLRQLRVKKNDCPFNVKLSSPARLCINGYQILNQEENNFSSGWKVNNNSEGENTYWQYQNLNELDGYPYAGKFNIYAGGGYAVTLPYTTQRSINVIKQLNLDNWIDRQTAAVFIEFSVYNANINLFASVVILLEKSDAGAFFAYPVISPIRLYEFVDGSGYFIVVIQIIFLITFVYKLFQMFHKIKIEKKYYFYKFWNLIVTVECLLAFIAIALYAIRHIQANAVLQKMKDDVNKEHFVNFQYLTLWNDAYICTLAFTVFFATIKFTRLLRFNRRILLLSYTLKHAAKPVACFSVMFSIYFVAFMFLSNFWFEQKILEYSTKFYALEEMFSMLLGRFDFTEIQNSDPILGPIFFCTFTGLCTIALLNMFIVILDDSIKKARRELESKKNRFEVLDYLFKKVGNFVFSITSRFTQKHDFKEDNQKREKMPIDLLEDKLNDLAKFVYKLEENFYAKVSMSELELELNV